MKKQYFIFSIISVLSFGFAKNSQCQWQRVYNDNNANCFASIGSKLFVYSSNGLSVSNDSGNTWSVILKYSQDSDVFSMASIGDNFFISASLGILASKDSGLSWKKITTLPFGSFWLIYKSDSELFVSNDNIYQSIDSGKHWKEIYRSQDCYVHNIIKVGNVLFASTIPGHEPCGVFRSLDGLTWVPTIPDTISSYWYFAVMGNKILAFPDFPNTIYISSDTGNYWKSFDIAFPSKDQITALAADSAYIFAGFWDGVALSRDTGKTWQKIGNFNYITSLYIFGDYIFAGPDSGIWRARISDLAQNDVHIPRSRISEFPLLSNPVSSSANFQFCPLQESEVFQLFDLLGRQLFRREVSIGEASLHIDLHEFPAGMYIARLGGESVKVVKE